MQEAKRERPYLLVALIGCTVLVMALAIAVQAMRATPKPAEANLYQVGSTMAISAGSISPDVELIEDIHCEWLDLTEHAKCWASAVLGMPYDAPYEDVDEYDFIHENDLNALNLSFSGIASWMLADVIKDVALDGTLHCVAASPLAPLCWLKQSL